MSRNCGPRDIISLVIPRIGDNTTKTPWLGRLAYDECNQAKLGQFENELISRIPMQQFMFFSAMKTTYPW